MPANAAVFSMSQRSSDQSARAMMLTEIAAGSIPPKAAALVQVLAEVLNEYASQNQISTSEALSAGIAFFGTLLIQAAVGNEWPREKEVAVRDWAIHSLAKLPWVSERDEDL
jgi:hypothetical protein